MGKGDSMRHLSLLFIAALVIPAAAEKPLSSVKAAVVDQKGNPVEGAVIFALDDMGPSSKPKTNTMEMVKMDFDPAFLVVTVGDSVSFPNKDTTHHHVYSFSKVKKFDSRLYKDGKPKIVKFDKAGLVKTGCKIHDWMRGTILVTESTRRVSTDAEGKATLKVSKRKSVRLGVYHPRIRGKHTKHEVEVALKDGEGTVDWTLKLKGEKNKKSKNRKIYY